MNTLVLRRRLIYISAMVAILIPLYFLGHPSVRRTTDDGGDSTLRQGGTLAQIRTAYSLHHSDLGQLAPASESARLATLGLRGVAATILWHKAEYYKREKYFDRLAATVNQLRILQPHFIKVWEFQAHNLAWNVSVEFDDYRQRYEWVKKGIHFLIDGSKYNKTRTEMPFELGWAFGNKMGMSDEKLQFREMYRNDRNFHNEVEDRTRLDLTQASGQGPDGKPDNWRSGTLWYLESYRMVDAGSRPARSPLMFYCKAAQWQYKHAESIQNEGYLGEEARNAWKLAGTGWFEYGQRQIRTSFGTIIFLNELQSAEKQYEEDWENFKEYCGEVYNREYQIKYGRLDEEQRIAIDKEPGDRSVEESRLAEVAKQMLEMDPFFLAKELPVEKQVAAIEMANKLRATRTRMDHIDRYRSQINYPYWELRCEAEQEDDALVARSKMYGAERLFDLGKLDEAIEEYDNAFAAWGRLFTKFPALVFDSEVDEVVNAIERYRSKFVDNDSKLPDDFPLNNFLEFRALFEEEMSDPSMMSIAAMWPQRYPGRNFLEDMLSRHPSRQTAADAKSPEASAESSIQDELPPESESLQPEKEVDQPESVSQEDETQPEQGPADTEESSESTPPDLNSESVDSEQPPSDSSIPEDGSLLEDPSEPDDAPEGIQP